MNRIKVFLPNEKSVDVLIRDLRSKLETTNSKGLDIEFELQAVENFMREMDEKAKVLEQGGVSVKIDRTFDLASDQVNVILQLPRKKSLPGKLLSLLGIR